MGDIVEAIDNVGEKAINIIDSRRAVKEQKHKMYYDYVNTMQKRKNLLNEQLASRRAKLGSFGMSSSASERAAQNRLVKDAYRDVEYNTEKYKRQTKSLDRDYRSQMYKDALSAFSNGTKMIK